MEGFYKCRFLIHEYPIRLFEAAWFTWVCVMDVALLELTVDTPQRTDNHTCGIFGNAGHHNTG